ncbi:MAG: sigma-70 family RNA polymerase sigma factor [Terriglobales bacterium]|jgi:RNA polymerase sigma-70 factor (ECF subfamily)
MRNNCSPYGGEQMEATSGSSATTSAALTKQEKCASEAKLTQRVLAGQNDAFYELVRPYERAVLMVAKGILHNEADAQEAAQEAILKAFTNLAKFRGDSKFSTWLIRIATNEALLKLRKDRRRKLHVSLDEQRTDEAGDYIPRDFADWREIPSETLERKELRQALSCALASLPSKYQLVLVLRDVQHFSIAETADALGIGESAVKTRLLRARLQMRDVLAPGMGGGWAAGQRGYKQVKARCRQPVHGPFAGNLILRNLQNS